MLLKESLLLSLHTFLIFFAACPPELSPLSFNENADGCNAAGQQHIVCQQRRKRNDDDPHLIDKIDTRLFFLQKPAYKKRRTQQEKRRNKNGPHFYKIFPLLMVLLLLQIPHKVGYLEKKGTLPSLSSKSAEKELEKSLTNDWSKKFT